MTDVQLAAIRRHGNELLRLFPLAKERDPVALCKKLRRLEAKAHAFALRGCNGPEWPSEEAQQAEADAIMAKVNDLLDEPQYDGMKPWLNRDPRGYALKITRPAEVETSLVLDWGDDLIVAPEIGPDGQ